MTQHPPNPPHDLATRRKAIRLRVRHRGYKELVLALEPFLRLRLDGLSASRVDHLEELLELEDLDLWEILVGRKEAPEGLDRDLLEAIRADFPGRRRGQ